MLSQTANTAMSRQQLAGIRLCGLGLLRRRVKLRYQLGDCLEQI